MTAPGLRWAQPGRLRVTRDDGGTIEDDSVVEVFDPAGHPLRRVSADPFTFHAAAAHSGSAVTVVIWRYRWPGGPRVRRSFRLTIPEVSVGANYPDPAAEPARVSQSNGSSQPGQAGQPGPAGEGEPAKAAGGVRISAVLALDFGTYGECAAIWDSAATPPDPSELSRAQLQAVNDAVPNHGFSSPGDVETRAGVAYVGLDEVDMRHDAWTAAFTVPPLEHRRLRPLVDAELRLPGPSEEGKISDPADGGSAPATAPSGLLGERGLKRALLAANPSPAVITELVNAYEKLHEEAVTAVSGSSDPDRRREPNQVQVTYPTRLPSKQRDDLISALRQNPSLRRVEAGVDEATAVAMFDLCVRLGQRPELGIGMLQARHSSLAPQDAGEDLITDHVLVIDVGAGTTDVALVEMKIEDKTPREAEGAPGRYWQLAPYVLSSGGALHFGADQLTLDFFNVLKKRLVDLNEAPETEFKRNHGAIPEFLRLWKAAEKAKERLLADPSVRSIRVNLGNGAGSPSVKEVTLDFKPDLQHAAQRFARRVAALAVGIAKAGLETAEQRYRGSDPDDLPDASPPRVQVDRVVLAGQTFRSDFIRHEVETAVRAFLHGESRKATFEVACYPDHLKSAASLGAAYGGGTWAVQPVAGNPRVISELRAGQNRFSLQTRTLWANLPAEFQERENHRAIFRRGQRLEGEPTEQTGDLRWARSAPFEVWNNIAVDRVDAEPLELEAAREQQSADDLRISWCNFLFPGFRQAQENPELSDVVRDVFMTFEVDERERLRLYVHHGNAVPLDLSEGTPRQLEPPQAGGPGPGPDAPLAIDGAAATDIHLGYISPVADGGLPIIKTGERLPRVVSLHESEGDAHVAILGPGTRTMVIPKEHRWLSLGVDGTLRSHPAVPSVASRPHDGTEQATLDFLRQGLDADSWAIELPMQPENHYSEESDPFSGIH